MNENIFATGTVSVGTNGDILTFSEAVALPANMKPGDRIEIDGLPTNGIAELVAENQARLVIPHVGAGFTGRRYIVFNMPVGWATNYDLQAQTAENIRKLNAGVVVRVSYKTRGELYADLSPAADQLGKVWNDPNPALTGLYKKIGPSGGGSWDYMGPLPETEAAKVEADRATQERQGAESARTGAEAALATIESIADVLGSATTITAPADYPTRDAAAAVVVPLPQLMLRTGGRFVPGDAGGALYKRSGGTLQPGGFADAGGAVWDLVGDEVSVESCGADDDYSTALGTAIDRAAQISANVVHRRRKIYVAETPVERTDLDARIFWNGCIVMRGIIHPNAPLLKLKYSFATPDAIASHGPEKIWAGYPTKEIRYAANPSDGQTLTLVQKTYTFRATPATANEVKIGATASETLDNLMAAINGAAGIGTLYGTGTLASTRVTAKRMSDLGGQPRLAVMSNVRCVTTARWNHGGTSGATVTEAHTQADAYKFTFASDAATLGYAVGTVAKAFSWDLIPHSRPSDSERLGEQVRIDLVDGNSVWTARPLRIEMGSDPVTSNPRMARQTARDVYLDQMHFPDEPGSPVDRFADMIVIEGAVEPKFIAPKCPYALTGFLRIESCYKPFSDVLDVEDLRTSIQGYRNAYGYGILEYGSTDGQHRGIRAARCRHGYTEGARTCPADSNDPLLFGGVVGTVTEGMHCVECEHSGVDVHPSARFVIHNNPVVMMGHQGAEAGVHAAQLRGHMNTINDLTAVGAGAIKIKTHGTGTGNKVSVKRFVRPAGYTVISPPIFCDGSEAADGFRPQATISGDFQIDDYGNAAFSTVGMDVDLIDMSIDYQNNAAAQGSIGLVEDALVTYSGLKVEFRRSTAAQPILFKAADAAAAVKGVGPLRVLSDTTIRWRSGNMNNSGGDDFDATIVLPDVQANVAPNAAATGGFSDLGANAIAWAAITVDNAMTAGPRNVAVTHSDNTDKTLSFRGLGDRVLRATITTSATGMPQVTSISKPAHTDQVLELYGAPASAGVTRIPTTCTNVVTPVPLLLWPGRILRFFASGDTWVLDRSSLLRDDQTKVWGDEAVNLSATAGAQYRRHFFNTPLTANRTVTLPSVDVGPLELARGPGASGNFNLSISPSVWNLRGQGDWVLLEWNGTAYVVSAFGGPGGARVRGNANTTDGASDLTTAIYNTAFTAPRTHTLRGDGPGRCRIVRTVVSAGNTLTIYQPDGVNVLTTLAAQAWVDVEREVATGVWWVTAAGALP